MARKPPQQPIPPMRRPAQGPFMKDGVQTQVPSQPRTGREPPVAPTAHAGSFAPDAAMKGASATATAGDVSGSRFGSSQFGSGQFGGGPRDNVVNPGTSGPGPQPTNVAAGFSADATVTARATAKDLGTSEDQSPPDGTFGSGPFGSAPFGGSGVPVTTETTSKEDDPLRQPNNLEIDSLDGDETSDGLSLDGGLGLDGKRTPITAQANAELGEFTANSRIRIKRSRSKTMVVIRNKKQVVLQSTILILALQEAYRYDPARQHNQPVPELWRELSLENATARVEIAELIEQLKQLNEHLTDLRKARPVINRDAERLKKSLFKFADNHAKVVGTSSGYLLIGGISALLTAMGHPEVVAAALAWKAAGFGK